MLRFATFLFILGRNILLSNGLPLFDSGELSATPHLRKGSGESFATRRLRNSLEPESEYPVVFDSGESFATQHLRKSSKESFATLHIRKSLELEDEYLVTFDSGESFGPRNSLPTAAALIPELENLTQSHLPSFRDCNATSDVVLMTSACPVNVFYSFDPNRIPRVLVNISCKNDELPGHFGLGMYRKQHVGCDAVSYKMPVLKMNPEARIKVYWPSLENIVLACVPAIFPSRDLREVNTEHLT
ncbi:hypothetical protein JTE90_005021 [Oedothorax gibbosus]|uniref:Uncharacterized protein n=1 Tax=Oedothorax gibbosus TaxID=931172 RepID=A0AAV6VCU7_9ARAC|nr:hypothetical protein JTE90_005021 [Oedothorax gibbosus]